MAIDSVTYAAVPTTGTAATTKKDQGSLDKDAFLKLLVEQLRSQDPTNPADSTQYTQQMTQYSVLEQLTNLNAAISTQGDKNDREQAIGLLGKSATYLDAEGNTGTGTVDNVSMTSSGPQLTIGSRTGLTLDDIIGVTEAPTTPAAPATPTSAATPTTPAPDPAA